MAANLEDWELIRKAGAGNYLGRREVNSGYLSLDEQLMMVMFKHDGGFVGLVHVELFCFVFYCGPFKKSLLNCYNIACFMFWCFGYEACGILVPWPGMEPASPALEGEVLTTGPSGKSQKWFIFIQRKMEAMMRFQAGGDTVRWHFLSVCTDDGQLVENHPSCEVIHSLQNHKTKETVTANWNFRGTSDIIGMIELLLFGLIEWAHLIYMLSENCPAPGSHVTPSWKQDSNVWLNICKAWIDTHTSYTLGWETRVLWKLPGKIMWKLWSYVCKQPTYNPGRSVNCQKP